MLSCQLSRNRCSYRTFLDSGYYATNSAVIPLHLAISAGCLMLESSCKNKEQRTSHRRQTVLPLRFQGQQEPMQLLYSLGQKLQAYCPVLSSAWCTTLLLSVSSCRKERCVRPRVSVVNVSAWRSVQFLTAHLEGFVHVLFSCSQHSLPGAVQTKSELCHLVEQLFVWPVDVSLGRLKYEHE